MKRIIRSVQVCLAAISLSAGLTQPTLSDDKPSLTLPEVLQRHLQAVGGKEALDALKSLRFMVASEVGGQKHLRVVTYKAPDKAYIVEVNGIMQSAVGYDGKVGWQRDTNGNIRLLTQDELQDLRDQLDLDTHREADATLIPDKITLRQTTEPKTGDYILDVVSKSGTALTRYIDPKTFQIVKTERTISGQLIRITYSDFRSYGGLSFATKRQASYEKITVVTALSDVHTNVDISDSDFALPPSTKNYEWLKPGATSVMMPFDYSDHSVRLYVGLNGQPAYIDLDSGTGGLVLDTQAANILKLKPEGEMPGIGYGGFFSEYPVVLGSLELPEAVAFSNLTATSVNLPLYFSIAPTVSTAGMIGYDLLSRFIVKIDYTAQQVTLSDPDTWTPSKEDGVALPLELDDNLPSVQVKVDDLPAGRFLIDTGDSASVTKLYPTFVKQNKLAEKYPHGDLRASVGAGGTVTQHRARIASVALAGITFKDVPTDFISDTHTPEHLAGALGNNFLSRYVVTFDYPHRRVFFAPNVDAGREFDTHTYGVYVVELPDAQDRKKTHFIITNVTKESPAARARLEAGQELLQVDGKPASDLGLAQIRMLLSAECPQQSHDLYVRKIDGHKSTFSVSSYDPLLAIDANKTK